MSICLCIKKKQTNTTLTVPPEEPKIFDAQGKEVSHIAGPFREGHELFLSCQVTGGKCIQNTKQNTY